MTTRQRETTAWGAQVGVRLEPDLAARLDRFCKATHRSRAQVGRWAIERLLAEEVRPHE